MFNVSLCHKHIVNMGSCCGWVGRKDNLYVGFFYHDISMAMRIQQSQWVPIVSGFLDISTLSKIMTIWNEKVLRNPIWKWLK